MEIEKDSNNVISSPDKEKMEPNTKFSKTDFLMDIDKVSSQPPLILMENDSNSPCPPDVRSEGSPSEGNGEFQEPQDNPVLSQSGSPATTSSGSALLDALKGLSPIFSPVYNQRKFLENRKKNPDMLQRTLELVNISTEDMEENIEEQKKEEETGETIINTGPMQISQESTGIRDRQECSGCKKQIADRYLLKALDQYWHEDCLKCSCCDCRLGEVGSTLFTKANLLLCRRDYLRLFGTTGYCAACSKMIPAFEMVMRAKTNVYHLECFACQQCNHRFCVGDRFFLCDNKILCEYDYEERMVFASMSYNYNALTQIKRQAQSLSDDVSSGYGSPSPNSL